VTGINEVLIPDLVKIRNHLKNTIMAN